VGRRLGAVLLPSEMLLYFQSRRAVFASSSRNSPARCFKKRKLAFAGQRVRRPNKPIKQKLSDTAASSLGIRADVGSPPPCSKIRPDLGHSRAYGSGESVF